MARATRFGGVGAPALAGLALAGAAGAVGCVSAPDSWARSGAAAAPAAESPATAPRASEGAAAPEVWVEVGPSFLPNLGLEAGLGVVTSRTGVATRSLELHGAWQFLDDEDFADDGNPKAGPWYQVRGGVRWTFAPESRRHLIARVGGVWSRAEGKPNVVQEDGDYLGVYGAVGFRTDLSPTVSVGPELTVLGITRTTKLSFARPVPQVNWHARIGLGGDREASPTAGPLPRGELYGGVSAVAAPGLGAGILFGQVFRRGASSTWAVEVSAAVQPPRGNLFFREDGRWAQVQVGAKGSFTPRARGHWVGRGGAVWLRSTADNPFLDVRADHIGAYAGLGYEYEMSGVLTTGPELSLMVVSYEQDVAFRLVPQLRWHLLVRP